MIGKQKAFWQATTFAAGEILWLVANEALGYPRAIMLDPTGKAVLFNPDTAIYGGFVGISSASALNGTAVPVRYSGEFSYTGWGLSYGPIFATANGVISIAPPTTGLVVVLGHTISPDAVQINPMFHLAL